MTLEESKNIVIAKEKERHKNDAKIFYPDPDGNGDCAQCGKSIYEHQAFVDDKSGMYFCKSKEEMKQKPYNELMDEAAELYAHSMFDEGKLYIMRQTNIFDAD